MCIWFSWWLRSGEVEWKLQGGGGGGGEECEDKKKKKGGRMG